MCQWWSAHRWRNLRTALPRWSSDLGSQYSCHIQNRDKLLLTKDCWPPVWKTKKNFFSEIYFTSTKVSRQVSDRKSVGLEEFVMEILRRIVLNTSRNPFCCSDILFSGTNISSVCWSTSIVCLWLNVPLPTSCPLKRTWYPVKRKVRTKLIA